MAKRKILYVITKSNFGGAQRYVYDLATNLPAEFKPVVALGGIGSKGAKPGLLQTRLEEAGVCTLVVPHFMRNMSLFDDVRAFLELWKMVRHEKPDVLHVTSSKAGGLGALVGRLHQLLLVTKASQTSFRVVFTSHGLTFDEAWRPWWQRALIYIFTWLTIFLSSKTIQISGDTYERARGMPFVGKKVVLIHNGIHAPHFLPRDEARRSLLPNLPNPVYERPWLGTIAEYHPNKNLDVLVESVALIQEHGTNIHLILIGEEGESRTHLEALAQKLGVADAIHLLGTIPHAAQYLQALDIFALPSKKEGLPYVLLEAGLAALPVVVSDIPGNTEIVTHEKTGLVIHGGAEPYGDAFTTLLKNPLEAQQYAKALYEDVQSRFSIEQMVRETKKTYTTM